ncbi:MAG: hypothetical protein QXD70_00915 [Candidatus Bathyarchaeia archaeon]
MSKVVKTKCENSIFHLANMPQTEKKSKPKWWIPYWIIQIVLAIVFWVAGYLLLNVPLLIASIGLAVTFVFIGTLYWIRIRQPNWLKSYWIALTASALAIAAASYFYLNAPPEKVITATALILLSLSLGYYIRVRPSVKINRAMYIGLGIVVIGFVLWISLMVFLNATGLRVLLERWLFKRDIPTGILPFLTLILCYIAGGYIGDWIGKRRNYHLPLYP